MDMVDDQIISRGIKDLAVIKAMRSVKRELFVKQELQSKAYQDSPLPIGWGQTISQPYIVAYMTEALFLKKSDRVLEVGTGSGYQTAILSKIVEKVYSVEIISELVEYSTSNLQKAKCFNICIKHGDGYKGWVEESPFDGILVTAAAPKIPNPLIEQLSPDNGRMIIPIGEEFGYQELVRLNRFGDDVTIQRLLPVRFVPFVSNKFT